MNAERWSNVQATRAAYAGGREEVAGLPHEVILEISARCNLRCQMCAINYDTRHRPSSGRPAFFPPELFARLRPLFPTLMKAHLYGLGEPVLNPHLADYVAELSAAGVETRFTTNATLIDDEKAETFARAGIDRISVSIDGVTAGTYETIRRGAKLEHLLRGLRALAAARRRHGRPVLTVNFVAMASNFHELPALVELCTEAGVEELNVEPLYFWGKESAELGEHYQREKLANRGNGSSQAILAEARRRAAEAGLHFSSYFLTSEGSMDYRRRLAEQRGAPRWRCSEPWSTIFVTAAGEVRPCCLNDTCFGNLNQASFPEIWNGETYRTFRREHAREGGAPAGCATCAANGRQRHTPLFEAVQPVSYRPLASLAPPAPAPRGFRLDWPPDGATVTDPLVILGTAPRRDLVLLRWLGERLRPYLRIDQEPFSMLEEMVVEDGAYALALPVPFLSEGTHWLSIGRGASRELAGDRRRVHLWRPTATAGLLRATGKAALLCPLPARIGRARVRIDGQPWTAFRWLCGWGRAGWTGAAVIDLEGLPPGVHALDVEPAGGAAVTRRLERLAAA